MGAVLKVYAGVINIAGLDLVIQYIIFFTIFLLQTFCTQFLQTY